MATLYLVPTAPPAVQNVPSAYLGGWGNVSTNVGASSGTASTTAPSGSATGSSSTAISNTAKAGLWQINSPPLAAGTISGTLTAVGIARSLAAGTIQATGYIYVAIYKGDGTGLRGTALLTQTQISSVGSSATAITTNWTGTAITITSGTAVAGDFLVIETGEGTVTAASTTTIGYIGGGTAITSNSATNTAPQAFVTFSSGLTFVPYPPTSLNATFNAGTGNIDLTWTAAVVSGTTLSSYTLLRSTTSGGETSYVTGIGFGAASYSDTSPNVGINYYTLVAVGASGSSLASNETSATVVLPYLPILNPIPHQQQNAVYRM